VGSQNPNQAQLTIALPSPALVDVPANTLARDPIFSDLTVDYTMLLPCIEVRTLADQMCPKFLGFRCPFASYNAASSNGVGYIDSGEKGDLGEGMTGNSQEQWGNV
jgi:calcium channel MID1